MFTSTLGVGFVPPRAGQLDRAASKLEFPPLSQAELQVGSQDWQSNPVAVRAFCDRVSVPITVVEGKGHTLGVDYVGPLLDRWLSHALSSDDVTQPCKSALNTMRRYETNLSTSGHDERNSYCVGPPPGGGAVPGGGQMSRGLE